VDSCNRRHERLIDAVLALHILLHVVCARRPRYAVHRVRAVLGLDLLQRTVGRRRSRRLLALGGASGAILFHERSINGGEAFAEDRPWRDAM
jgi:hypothetical protein